MKLIFKNFDLQSELLLTFAEKSFDPAFFTRDREHKYLTIAWNRGGNQKVSVYEIEHNFLADSVLPLMVNQSVSV